jgi:E1-E2 ATPase/Domain of unknown function (DUF4118)
MSTPVQPKQPKHPEALTSGQASSSLFDPAILRASIWPSFTKLDPRKQLHNPVMFVVEIGAVITTIAWLIQAFGGAPLGGGNEPWWFTFTVTVWLWLTVVFANFAEALAEGRGKAQAAALRSLRTDTTARLRDGGERRASELRPGDLVVIEAGEVIPGDGDVVEGIASVDESAITGESAPVIRAAGGDRSAVTGGTLVLSDRIVVQVTAPPGESFLDRMIALVEGADRRKTPNEIALNILLAAMTAVFLVIVVSLRPFALFANTAASTTTLIALLVALIPTTIGALLSAIGIAGMDRLVRRNVMALSGRAVEASGDVDVLLLDKTGTITQGNREAVAFIPMPGVTERELAEVAHMSSLADETPEGRSIVELAVAQGVKTARYAEAEAEFVPFSATTRMRGAIGFAASIVAGVVLSPFRGEIGLENVVIVYLAVVATTAAVGGRGAGLLSSLSAARSYNWFFTTPYYTLWIDSVRQVVTVVLLFAAGLLASLGGRASAGPARRRARKPTPSSCCTPSPWRRPAARPPTRSPPTGWWACSGRGRCRSSGSGMTATGWWRPPASTSARSTLPPCPISTRTAASRPAAAARSAARWCCRPRAPRSTWSATTCGSARWWSCRRPTGRCCAPPGRRSRPSPRSWPWPASAGEHRWVLRRRGDVVGGVGLALPQRLLGPGGGVLGGLQLHLGVQLRAEQHRERAQEQPEHQDDDAGQGAVGLVVVAEGADVQREHQRAGHPQDRGHDRAPADP